MRRIESRPPAANVRGPCADVPPRHVRSLDDYWRWFAQQLDQSGGWLEQEPLQVQIILDSEATDPMELAGLIILRQRMRFHDDSWLEFQVVVNRSLESVEYNYHYATARNELIWRMDKHGGHHQHTHIHRPPSPRVAEPYDEVEITDVLEEIRKLLWGL
jgi:Family of unknown function (DUF6516)